MHVGVAQHRAHAGVDHQVIAGQRLRDDVIARAGVQRVLSVVDDEGVVAAARADGGIGARQHELGLMADCQRRARQHAGAGGTALRLVRRDQAQLVGGIRHADGGGGHRAVGVQRGLHARRQREHARQAGRDGVLAVGHLQAPLGVQAGRQRVQIVPRRGGVGSRDQLARVRAADGNAQRLAGRVDQDALPDGVQQLGDGAHTFQPDIDARVGLVGKQECQRRALGRRVAGGQVRQVGLRGDAGKGGGVDGVGRPAALHHEAEVIHVGECAVDRDAARADGKLAVVQRDVLAARGQLDGVGPGGSDHLRRVGVADDEIVRQPGLAVQHGGAREARGIDPVAVFAADDAGAGDAGVRGRGGLCLVGGALDPADAADLLERHIAQPAAGGHLRLVARAVDAGQAIGGHDQFGGGVRARAARDRIAAAQQHDLMARVGAGAGLDHAARHQAADQHRIAAERRSVDQGGTQSAVQARVAEDAVQGVGQHRIGLACRQRRAVGLVGGRQRGVAQREIPLAVFVQRIAQGAGLRPQLVRSLITRVGVVAQTALQDVGARAADQAQIAAIIRAVQRDERAGVIRRAHGRRRVDGAIVLQGHGVHAAQGHRSNGACAHGRVRQRGRGLVARQRGVAVHARDVFGGAARGQVADHQIVAAAPADAVLATAVGHGNDVVAQAADDVVAIGAARADDVADVQHARHAAGVVQAGVAVLEIQVDGDVVFIARVVQRGLAGHAEEHLHVQIADQGGRAVQGVDRAVRRHARAQVDGNAAAGLHARRNVRAILGQVQRVAALAGLLGQREADGPARDDVGVAAAAAADDVLRVVDRDGGVAHHRDLVAALRRTLDAADRSHITESGGRRRRNFFAIGVRRRAG